MRSNCLAYQGLRGQVSIALFFTLQGCMTLLVHLLALPIRRVGVSRVHLAIALLVHLLHPSGVLTWDLSAGRGITDRGQLRTHASRVILRRWLGRVGGLAVSLRRRTLSLVVSLALVLLLLLPRFPLFADLFELCGNGDRLAFVCLCVLLHARC